METDQSHSQKPAPRSRQFVAGAGLLGLVSLLTGCPSTAQTRPEPVQQNGFAWYTQGEVQAGYASSAPTTPTTPLMSVDRNTGRYGLANEVNQQNDRSYTREGDYLGGRVRHPN